MLRHEKGEQVSESETHARFRVMFVDSSATQGGGQLSAERMLRGIDGLDAHIAYLSGGPVADRLTADGYQVHVLGEDRPKRIQGAQRYLSRLIKKLAPDAVVALSTSSARTLALIPRGREVRLLRLSEDMARYKNRGLKSLVYFKVVFPSFDGFISNSEWTDTTIPSQLARRPHAVAYPISGVVVSSSMQPTSFESDVVRIITLSRPEPWKGIDLAIEACANLVAADPEANLRLSIYGGGHNTDPVYLESLTMAAERAPLRVEFPGHVDDVSSVLKEADIVLVPSTLPEPFGQVTVQALAAGCVPIVSNHGGSLEIVKDGVNGLTFISGDIADLTRCMSSLISDRATAKALAKQAPSSAQRFADVRTIPAMQAAIIDLHDAVRSAQRRAR